MLNRQDLTCRSSTWALQSGFSSTRYPMNPCVSPNLSFFILHSQIATSFVSALWGVPPPRPLHPTSGVPVQTFRSNTTPLFGSRFGCLSLVWVCRHLFCFHLAFDHFTPAGQVHQRLALMLHNGCCSGCIFR